MDPNRFVHGQFQAQMAPVQVVPTGSAGGGYFFNQPAPQQPHAQQYGLPVPLQVPGPQMVAVPTTFHWQPGAAYAPTHHVQPQNAWMSQPHPQPQPQPQPVPGGQIQPMGFVQPAAPQQQLVPVNDDLFSALAETYLREARARKRAPDVNGPAGEPPVAGPAAARSDDNKNATQTGPAISDALQLSAEDEKVLVDALREGKARGQTVGQVLELLQKSNGRPPGTVGWQHSFVHNIEQLLPQVQVVPAAREGGVAAASGSSNERGTAPSIRHDPRTSRGHRRRPGANSKTQEKKPKLERKLATATSSGAPQRENAEANVNTRGRAGDGWKFVKDNTSNNFPASRTSTSSSASGRLRRGGGPVPEYHAGTYIPPVQPSTKPKAPCEDPRKIPNHFSDEDKIFLIHYLRWRLTQEREPGGTSAVPSKATLLRELAKEAPHHDFDAWRKHWDAHCELPDQIYIAARKQAGGSDVESVQPASSARLTSLTTESESDDVDPSDDDSDNGDDDPSATYDDGAPAAFRPRPPTTGKKVTEQDLRAMAEYMFEKRAEWEAYSTHLERWREFAHREENSKRRTHVAWNCAARSYAKKLQEYFDELVRARIVNASDSENEEKEAERLVASPLPVSSAPAQTSPTAPAPSGENSKARADEGGWKKRMAEIGGSNSVRDDSKRVKVEVIDLTVSD